jgi:hypothetical protein
LNFATASIIESLRRNPQLCNFVLNDISNNYSSYASNYISLILPGQQSFSYLNDDIYSALILEEAEKIYNKFTTKLTNKVIAAAATSRTSLPSLGNNNQNLTHKDDEIEEPRYNNQPEIYNNDQQLPNE